MTFAAPLTDREILAARPPKNWVDPARPVAFLVEPECQPGRAVEDVAVVFLTNRECPFRCLMCDLWKNTSDDAVPLGAIPDQIDFALQRLPSTRHLKLYNSGNFFDPLAIPPDDYAAIASRVRDFATVIVENHPRLCGRRIDQFLESLRAAGFAGSLEVAMGLETVHPEVLQRLNKQMTTDDFRDACGSLHSRGVATRAFVLLRPPTLSEAEGAMWAERSIEFAFDCGVGAVSVIPTRAGNGIMDQLQLRGEFAAPGLDSLETVLAFGIGIDRGRVFVDLWDLPDSIACSAAAPARLERLRQMNLQQQVLPAVSVAPVCPRS